MHTQRVEEWMSAPPIVASPTTTIAEAQRLMEQHCVRRLPVVQDGRLVGIVSWGDLRAAQPSAATTLSVYEWCALLRQATIAGCMTHNPITIAPDAPVLEAARQMLAHKIGGLPVVTGGRLVGVISETDLLRLLLADETRLAELAVGGR
jgi:CBS domain-containing protein